MSLCFECGQCCQSFRVSFYHGEVEGSRHGYVPQHLITKISPHLACMKGTELGGSKCVALSYSSELGYRCSIYENRPSPCRDFTIFNADGTPNRRCQELREKAGLKPAKTL